MIGGTASATVPFIAAAVAAQGTGGAAKVCLAASVFMMIFCVLRLGRYVAKVPHPVVSGFSCGVGAMMVILQLRTLLGLPSLARQPRRKLAGRAAADHENSSPDALGAVVARPARRRRRGRRRPSLAAIARHPCSALCWPSPAQLCSAGTRRRWGRCRFPCPRSPSSPGARPTSPRSCPAALGLAFVASVNILITSRVVEHFQGRHRPLRAADADAELGAYGIANLFAGVFGAPLSVGIPARSLANLRCGGTTRLSNLLHAVFLLMLAGFGAGLIARIPLAALAGVTAYVGLGLLEWSTWRRLPADARLDAAAFLATAAAVLSTNAVAAVAIGCSFYVVQTSSSRS